MFRKKKYYRGILTEDVFMHSLSFDNKTSVIFLDNLRVEFEVYQINEILRKFKTCFGLELTVCTKKNEVIDIEIERIFKIVNSEDNDGKTTITFFYKNSNELFSRTVIKPSDVFTGFQSSEVLRPWFKISPNDVFILIPDYVPYFHGIGYYPSVDYSGDVVVDDKETIEDYKETVNIDYDDLGF